MCFDANVSEFPLLFAFWCTACEFGWGVRMHRRFHRCTFSFTSSGMPLDCVIYGDIDSLF